MDLETRWYEAFPYLYGIGGIVALVALVVHSGSNLLRVSGVLLIVASVTILRLRWVYRREAARSLPTAAEVAARPICDD